MGDRDEKKVKPDRKLMSDREFISVMNNNPVVEMFVWTTKEGNKYYNVTLNGSYVILEINHEIDVMINEVKQDDSTPGLAFSITNALPKDLADALILYSRLKFQVTDAFVANNWKANELRLYPMIKVFTFGKVKDADGVTMWVKQPVENIYINIKIGTITKTGSKYGATAFYDVREQYDWKKLPKYQPPSKTSMDRVEDKAEHALHYNSHAEIVEAWGRSVKVIINLNLFTVYVSAPNKICTMKCSAEAIGVLKCNAMRDNSFMKNKILAQVKAKVGDIFKLPK